MNLLTTDWQTFAVAIIILAAFLYTARRALSRLRAFGLRGRNASAPDCATGCGKCGDDVTGRTAVKSDPLVQITTQSTSPTHQKRH